MAVNWDDFELAEDEAVEEYPQSEYPRRADYDLEADVPEQIPGIRPFYQNTELMRAAAGGRGPMDAGTDFLTAVGADSGLFDTPEEVEFNAKQAEQGRMQQALAQRAGVEEPGVGLKLATAGHDALRRASQMPLEVASFANTLTQFPRLMDALGIPSPSGGQSWASDEQRYLEQQAAENAAMAESSDIIYGENKAPYQFASGAVQALAELPASMLGGALARGTGMIDDVGRAITGAAVSSGFTGAARRQAMERGSGRGEFEALPSSLVSGAITGLTTKAFGATGAESIFRNQGVKGIWNRISSAARDAGMEGVEEASDEFQQVFLDLLDKDPNLSVEDAISRTLMAGAIGSFVGGAVSGGRQLATATRERINNARQNREAAPFYGDVRQAPVEGEGQVPTAQGGGGVSPQAAATPQGQTPLTDAELEEVFQLQQMQRSGRLGAEDAQRLSELQEIQGSGMSPEERTYLEEIKPDLDAGVEIRADFDDNEPFAGMIATINRGTGKIVVNPREFSLWLREVPPAQRKQAVRTLMAEESIHLATPDQDASRYWDSMTAVEKSIARRRYTGKWSGKALTGVELTDTNFGHEALRARIQQLSGMDPTEIASAAGVEKWTLKGLTAVENAVFDIRKALGTKASREQQAMLDRVLGNIKIAKQAVEGGGGGGQEPAAIRIAGNASAAINDFAQKFMRGPGEFSMTNADTQRAGLGLKGVEDLNALLELRRAATTERNELRAEAQRLIASGDQAAAMKAMNRMALIAPKTQYVREAIETATNLGSWVESSRTQLGPRPLDWEKNPEVAKWIQEHGSEVGVSLPESAPAAVRRTMRVDKSGKITEEPQRNLMAEALFSASKKQQPETLRSIGLAAKTPWLSDRSKAVSKSEKGSAQLEVDDSSIVIKTDISQIQKSALLKKAELDGKSLVWDSPHLAKKQTLYEPPTPAAIRRSGMSKRGQEIAEQKRRIAEMFAKARGEELPPELQAKASEPTTSPVAPEERVSAEQAGALPSLSGRDLEAKAREFISGEVKTGEDRPGFGTFSEWAKRNMEGVKPEQLRDLWEDSVWSHLLKADSARLTQWRKALGLEAKYGSRKIADRSPDAPDFELELGLSKAEKRAQEQAANSLQRYRNKVISAIARKLISESVEGRQSMNRESVSVEDVAFSNEKTEFGPYAEINQDDIADPKRLNAILRDQARGSSLDPESASRRAVAVVDASGRVFLLTTYNDAGIQRVVDPTGGSPKAKPTRELNRTFLNQYRPFASLLLSDPIKGLRQRFESVSEFNDKIGSEAKERSRIGEWEAVPEGPAPEDFTAEGTPGLEGEGGMLMGPGRRLTETGPAAGALESESAITTREADAIMRNRELVGGPKTPESIIDALDALSERAKAGNLTPVDRLAISAYRKIFNALDRQRPDSPREALVEHMGTVISDAFNQSETTQDFLREITTTFGGRFVPEPEERPPVNLPTQLQTPRETGGTYRRGIQRGQVETQIPQRIGPEKFPGIESGEEYEQNRAWHQAANAEVAATKVRVDRAKNIRRRYYEKKGVLMPWREAERLAGIEPEPFGPAAIRRRISRAQIGRTLSDLILRTGSSYDQWLVDRLEQSGGALAEQVAPVFRAIIDREKKLYGDLTPALDKARAAAGGTTAVPVVGQVPNVEAMRATRWLHGLKKIKGAPFAAVSNTVGAIENTQLVPPYAQSLVDSARLANLEIGVMLQGVIRGFRASGKFARNITATAYDAIREGRGNKLWDKWTAGIAKANGKKIGEVRTFFDEFKKILDTPGVDVNTIEKVNQDFTRVFPKVVTHIHHNGQWQQMVHSDLFNYLENAARRATHIRAFREQIPNNAQGRQMLNSINEDLRREMGTRGQQALDALLKTMQGIPTDNYSQWGFLSPTEPVGQAFRVANSTVGNLMARLALTGQMFVQPGEIAFGSTPVFLGYKNYLRGLAQLNRIYSQLEQDGMVNRVMYDFNYDPNSRIRSIFRIGSNSISKLFGEQALNELQEALAASTARVTAERIQKGALDDWEKKMLPETFKAMGFNADEVAGLMQGDQELLGQFQRKAAAFLTSGNKAISEGSKLGANRLFNSIFRFQSYPMMKLNQLRRVGSSFASAWGDGTPVERDRATRQMARFLFGNAAQGAMTAAITALAYSGLMGLKIKMEEAEDEPVDFMTDMFMSTVSGPMYVAWRGLRNKGLMGISENMTRMVFPFSVANELIDFASGAGKYSDKSWFNRIGKFLDSKTPGTRAISTGLALFGLSEDDKALDAAIDGFYRWRRDEQGFTEREDHLRDDKRVAFRTKMKEAIQAMRDGDQDKFLEAYADAAAELVELGSKEKPGESLSRATVLRAAGGGRKLTEEEMDSLRARIGEEAVERLEWYDLMLEEAAKGNLLPRYDE